MVLKAEAEGLVHRTDAGGVRVDLRTPREVAEAYRTLAADFELADVVMLAALGAAEARFSRVG